MALPNDVYQPEYYQEQSTQTQFSYQYMIKSLDSRTAINASVWLFTASMFSVGAVLLMIILKNVNYLLCSDDTPHSRFVPNLCSGLMAASGLAGAGMLLLASTKGHLRLKEYFSEPELPDVQAESSHRRVAEESTKRRRSSSVRARWD